MILWHDFYDFAETVSIWLKRFQFFSFIYISFESTFPLCVQILLWGLYLMSRLSSYVHMPHRKAKIGVPQCLIKGARHNHRLHVSVTCDLSIKSERTNIALSQTQQNTLPEG